MTAPVGAILAGGRSSRLGTDKARVDVGGVASIERVRIALAEAGADVVVVGRPGQEPPLGEIPFVTDRHPERCVLAGIVRALELAGPRRAVVTGCDHPLLSADLVRMLLGRAGRGDVHIPLVQGRLAPLVAVYESPAALGPLARRLSEGRLGAVRALNELELDIVPEDAVRAVDPELASFLNLNTPEDLALISLRAGPGGQYTS